MGGIFRGELLRDDARWRGAVLGGGSATGEHLPEHRHFYDSRASLNLSGR